MQPKEWQNALWRPAVIGRDQRAQMAKVPEQGGRIPAESEVSPTGNHS
jgi:hypothetical protein